MSVPNLDILETIDVENKKHDLPADSEAKVDRRVIGEGNLTSKERRVDQDDEEDSTRLKVETFTIPKEKTIVKGSMIIKTIDILFRTTTDDKLYHEINRQLKKNKEIWRISKTDLIKLNIDVDEFKINNKREIESLIKFMSTVFKIGSRGCLQKSRLLSRIEKVERMIIDIKSSDQTENDAKDETSRRLMIAINPGYLYYINLCQDIPFSCVCRDFTSTLKEHLLNVFSRSSIGINISTSILSIKKKNFLGGNIRDMSWIIFYEISSDIDHPISDLLSASERRIDGRLTVIVCELHQDDS